MKRLLSYMGAYKKESILGPLFKMLEASFELFVPLVVASMVDVGIANRSVTYVVRMGGLLLLLAAIGLTCSLTAQYFAAKQPREQPLHCGITCFPILGLCLIRRSIP